ncbi:hypothetical protein SAI_2047 [Streptococcus agalactiae H36B]|nr:hypothetical protein SAI_2047 [Streptococcus agalactiae H36B]
MDSYATAMFLCLYDTTFYKIFKQNYRFLKSIAIFKTSNQSESLSMRSLFEPSARSYLPVSLASK